MAKSNERCSFCGRERKETPFLKAGLNAHICDHCIQKAKTIMDEEATAVELNAAPGERMWLLETIRQVGHVATCAHDHNVAL